MLCTQKEDKLCTLLSFLTQLPGKLEMIADEIDDENLRNALGAVADESRQYGMELKAQLKNLKIAAPVSDNHDLEEEVIERSVLNCPKEKGKEVLSICESCEAFFSNLYTDLLEEYVFNTSLRNMMSYQLLGIKSAFMRIRFLNTLRLN